MASPSSTDALKFRLSSISTVSASCERLLPLSKSGAGKFLSRLELNTSQLPEAQDTVHVTLTLHVAGVPKDSPDALAFRVTCCVDTDVRFNRPHGDDLPRELSEYIGALLFQVAGERCRAMISTMGYPGHALGASPPRFTSDDVAPSKSVAVAVKKAPARATRAAKAK